MTPDSDRWQRLPIESDSSVMLGVALTTILVRRRAGDRELVNLWCARGWRSASGAMWPLAGCEVTAEGQTSSFSILGLIGLFLGELDCSLARYWSCLPVLHLLLE